MAVALPPQRRSLHRGWLAARKPRAATNAVPPALRMRTAAAAAGGQSARPAHDPDSAILVLAGFHLEELVTVRQMLDEVGGAEVRVVPTTPALLYAPATEALRRPEAPWDRPMPADWQPGGGWGQQRMVLMAGIVGDGQQMVLDLLQEGGMPGVVPAVATPDNWDMALGQVLADALKAWRQHGGGIKGAAGATAAAAGVAAAGAAAAGAGEAEVEQEAQEEEEGQEEEGEEEDEDDSLLAAEAELGVEFVDDLPPLESVVPEEVWHPHATPRSDSDDSRESNMVQAEFSESLPQQGSGSAAAAASADGSAAPGQDQRAPNAAEEEEMDGEEVLAAARAAMGLDDGRLQQLVDDAAAKAAAAFNIPFVPGGVEAAAAAEQARPPPPQARAPAARATPGPSSRGPMPWDPPAAGSAKQTSTGAAPAPKRGFAPSSTAKKSSARKSKGGSKAAKGRAAEATAGSAGPEVTRVSADEGAAEPRGGAAPESPPRAVDTSDGAIPDNDRPIPSTDQFILSKSQLMKLSEKHGIDFEELQTGLASKGIKLAD